MVNKFHFQMTQHYTIKHSINNIEQNFVLCQDRSMVFIYHSITPVHQVENIHAEQLNFSATSNMEMVGIYPAALKKRGKGLVEASKTTLQHFLNISYVVRVNLDKYVISASSCFFSLSTVLMNDLVK